MKLFMVPRSVAFIGDLAVAAGVAVDNTPHDRVEVIHLPTDHVDFLGPYDFKGKTSHQIRKEIRQLERDSKCQ